MNIVERTSKDAKVLSKASTNFVLRNAIILIVRESTMVFIILLNVRVEYAELYSKENILKCLRAEENTVLALAPLGLRLKMDVQDIEDLIGKNKEEKLDTAINIFVNIAVKPR